MEGERYDEAIRRFDQENAADPRTVIIDGDAVPRELYFARKLTEWILRLEPGASEVLRLAARCQHLCRWKIPRSDYPLDRASSLAHISALNDVYTGVIKDFRTAIAEAGKVDPISEDLMQQILIKRFYKTQVIMSGKDSRFI